MRGLYAITPNLTDTDCLLVRVEQALRGGARILQYRNKQAGNDLARIQAEVLRALTRDYGAIFIINDDLQLAIDVGADGVHLGGEDGDMDAACLAAAARHAARCFVLQRSGAGACGDCGWSGLCRFRRGIPFRYQTTGAPR